ncbi:MAG: hypothetical protein ACKO0Z_22350 [Betaproteobacteria bacterium]
MISNKTKTSEVLQAGYEDPKNLHALNSPQAIRREMVAVYNQLKLGKIKSEMATKRIYILNIMVHWYNTGIFYEKPGETIEGNLVGQDSQKQLSTEEVETLYAARRIFDRYRQAPALVGESRG